MLRTSRSQPLALRTSMANAVPANFFSSFNPCEAPRGPLAALPIQETLGMPSQMYPQPPMDPATQPPLHQPHCEYASPRAQSSQGVQFYQTTPDPVLTSAEIAALFPEAFQTSLPETTSPTPCPEPSSAPEPIPAPSPPAHRPSAQPDALFASLVAAASAVPEAQVAVAGDESFASSSAHGSVSGLDHSSHSDENDSGSSLLSGGITEDLLSELSTRGHTLSETVPSQAGRKMAKVEMKVSGQGRVGKQAKIRRYSHATPSRFCHVCARSSEIIELVPCRNVKYGVCRKAVCRKCFLEQGWDWESAVAHPSSYSCCHCTKICPRNAQCSTYRRTNERRRVTGQRKRLIIEEALATGGDIEALLSQNGFWFGSTFFLSIVYLCGSY